MLNGLFFVTSNKTRFKNYVFACLSWSSVSLIFSWTSLSCRISSTLLTMLWWKLRTSCQQTLH